MGLLLSWINAAIGWPFLWPVLCLTSSGLFLSVRKLRESERRFVGFFRVAPLATLLAVIVFCCGVGAVFWLSNRGFGNWARWILMADVIVSAGVWMFTGWGIPALLRRFGVCVGRDGATAFVAGSMFSGALLVTIFVLSIVLYSVQCRSYPNTVPWTHTTVLVDIPGNPVLQQRRMHFLAEYDLRLVFAQNGTNFAVNLPMNTGGKTEINVYLLPSQKSGETDGIVFDEKRHCSILWFPGLDLQGITGNDVTGVLFVDYDIDKFGFPSGCGYSYDPNNPPKVVRKWSDYRARRRFLGKVDGFQWIPADETTPWER